MITDRQRAFIDSYLVCRNASRAAEAAGYSPKAAGSQGYRLLKNAEIQAEIARVQDKATTSAVMTLTEACERMTTIARGDDDELAIKAVARLAKLLSWDAPTKIAPTTPDGSEAWAPRMTPDESVTEYMEAIQRAVDAANNWQPAQAPAPAAAMAQAPAPAPRKRGLIAITL